MFLQQPAGAPPLQVGSREELSQLDTNRIVQLEPEAANNPLIGNASKATTMSATSGSVSQGKRVSSHAS